MNKADLTLALTKVIWNLESKVDLDLKGRKTLGIHKKKG
jgi:hypothetical protein